MRVRYVATTVGFAGWCLEHNEQNSWHREIGPQESSDVWYLGSEPVGYVGYGRY